MSEPGAHRAPEEFGAATGRAESTGAATTGAAATEATTTEAATTEAATTEAGPTGAEPAHDGTQSTGAVQFVTEARLPTAHGEFVVRAYHEPATGVDHLALIAPGTAAASDGATSAHPDSAAPAAGTPRPALPAVPLVRVHSECLTGEAFDSLKCECGPQLRMAMRLIQAEGGVLLYLRGHEGRGIGLANKLRAYALQEQGRDTLDANLELGLPADARDYRAAAAMLHDLGVRQIRLLSNNPDKARQLAASGITLTEQVPLIVDVNAVNVGYLNAKRDRMGHQLPQDLTAAALPEHTAEEAK